MTHLPVTPPLAAQQDSLQTKQHSMEGDLRAVQARLKEDCDSHSPRWDSFLYNGGTVVVLAATMAVTVVSDFGSVPWLPRALSGCAAFLVGLERALNFGGRWRFHREMRHYYKGLIDRIDFYISFQDRLSPEQRSVFCDEIWRELRDIRRREEQIPGVSTQPSVW